MAIIQYSPKIITATVCLQLNLLQSKLSHIGLREGIKNGVPGLKDLVQYHTPSTNYLDTLISLTNDTNQLLLDTIMTAFQSQNAYMMINGIDESFLSNPNQVPLPVVDNYFNTPVNLEETDTDSTAEIKMALMMSIRLAYELAQLTTNEKFDFRKNNAQDFLKWFESLDLAEFEKKENEDNLNLWILVPLIIDFYRIYRRTLEILI